MSSSDSATGQTDAAAPEPSGDPRQRLRRIAIHEAGHAVIGRVLAQVCGSATIDPPDKAQLGYAIITDPYTTMCAWKAVGRRRSFYAILRGRIMASMAGVAAEVVVLGDCSGGFEEDDCEIDVMLDALVPDASAAQRAELRQRLCLHAIRCVIRHRAKIEAVAEALLTCRWLTGAEIDGILGLANRPPSTAKEMPD